MTFFAIYLMPSFRPPLRTNSRGLELSTVNYVESFRSFKKILQNNKKIINIKKLNKTQKYYSKNFLKWWPFWKRPTMDKYQDEDQIISTCGTAYCACGCGSHSSTHRQIVITKHYKSIFFKETFSDNIIL